MPKILYHFNIANGNDKLMLMKIANVLKYHNCNCNKYTQLIFMSNLSKSQHSSQWMVYIKYGKIVIIYKILAFQDRHLKLSPIESSKKGLNLGWEYGKLKRKLLSMKIIYSFT